MVLRRFYLLCSFFFSSVVFTLAQETTVNPTSGQMITDSSESNVFYQEELVRSLMNYNLSFGNEFETEPVYFLPDNEELELVKEALENQENYAEGEFPMLEGRLRVVGDIITDGLFIDNLPLSFCLETAENNCETLLAWDTGKQAFSTELSLSELIAETGTGVVFDLLMTPETTKRLMDRADLKEAQEFSIKAMLNIPDPRMPNGVRPPVEMTRIKIMTLPDNLRKSYHSVNTSVGYTEHRFYKPMTPYWGNNEIGVGPGFIVDLKMAGGDAGFSASAKARAYLYFKIFGWDFYIVDAGLEAAMIPGEKSQPGPGTTYGKFELLGAAKENHEAKNALDDYNKTLNDYEKKLEKGEKLTDAERKNIDDRRQAVKNVANALGLELKQDGKPVDKNKTVAQEKTEQKSKFAKLKSSIVDLKVNSGLDGDKIALQGYVKSLGLTLWEPKYELEMKIEGGKGFRKEIGVSVTIWIVIIPVKLEAGAYGQLGVQWVLRSYNGFHGFQAKAGPFVDFGAYAKAGINLLLVEGGVKGQLSILKDEIWVDFTAEIHSYAHLFTRPFSDTWNGYTYTNSASKTVTVKPLLGGSMYNILYGPSGSFGPYVRWFDLGPVTWKCWWIFCIPIFNPHWEERYWPIASFSTFKRTDYFFRFGNQQ